MCNGAAGVHIMWFHRQFYLCQNTIDKMTTKRKHKIVVFKWICFIVCTLVWLLTILLIPTSQLEKCPDSATLDKPDEVNAEIVRNYPIGDSVPYLGRLGLLDTSNFTDGGLVPVIVLAASMNHFSESNAIIDRLVYDLTPKLRIVLYDLGYTEKQHLHMTKRGDCEVRKFPFEEFPTFVQDSVTSFAWKPLVIQLALNEFGFVIWMDTAIYLPERNVYPAIEVAIREGIAISYRTMGNTGAEYRIAYTTDPRTFSYLGENKCAFTNTFQTHASFIAVRKTRDVLRHVMRPWVSCALTKACLVLDRKPVYICEHTTIFGFCHKFDQSVLSIILNRLYHNSMDKIDLRNRLNVMKCYIRENVVIIGDTVVFESDPKAQDCPKLKFIGL